MGWPEEEYSHSWTTPVRAEKPFPRRLPDVARLEAEARGKTREKKYAEATALLERAHELDPIDPQVLIELADAYGALRRMDDALAAIDRALGVHPNWTLWWDSVGLTLLNQGFELEGVAFYLRLVELFPAEPDAHKGLANALVRTRELDQAVAEYEAAMALEPENWARHMDLGGAYARLDRYEEAVPHLQEAVRLGPEYSITHAELAETLVALEQYEEAAEEYRQVLGLLPRNTSAMMGLAHALRQLGRENGAKTLLAIARSEEIEQHKEWIADLPESPFAYVRLGLKLENQDQLEEAEAAYRDAIRVGPDEPLGYEHLADLLERRGEMAEVRNLREHAIPLTQAKLEAEPQWMRGMREQAIQFTQTELETAARWMADPFGSLGKLHAQLGNYTEARVAFEKATALKPTYLYAWLGLGDALLELKRPEDARAAFEQVLALHAEGKGGGWYHTDFQAYYGLGRAHSELNNRGDAEAAWRMAWRLVQEHNLREHRRTAEMVVKLEAVMPEPPPPGAP